MKTTYILGHVKPDTDAVVAAMGLAYLYQQTNEFPNPVAAITEPLNPETTFLFEKYAVTPPMTLSSDMLTENDCVVLVDHNEADQRLSGLNPDLIVGIVDHHKFNLNVNNPIAITAFPWGSSSTIVYHLMKMSAVIPDKKLASLLLAAVLSDTVGCKSATTTQQDREIVNELAQVAEITDIEAFTLEIFMAKSNISSLTDEQIVKNDYKVFDFGKKTMIDQLETVEQEKVLSERKTSLLAAMTVVKQELQADLIFVAVTDILKVNTKLLILSEEEARIAQLAFGGTVIDNILDIGPKMSRKKEIAPPIEKALQ